MTDEKQRQLIQTVVERLKWVIEDEGDNRRLAFEDLEFIAIEGKQWPAEIKAEREANGQPC